MYGSHTIKVYSRTQSTLALNSAEAEFYALTSADSEGLGFKAMAAGYGEDLDVFLYADASAAIGIANREGLGRILHLAVQSLWLQAALRERRLGVRKVLGTAKPSD